MFILKGTPISVLQRKEAGSVIKLLEADAIYLFSFKHLFLHALWKNPIWKHSRKIRFFFFNAIFGKKKMQGKSGEGTVAKGL